MASWGVLGVIALFIDAIYRLGLRAFEAYTLPLSTATLLGGLVWSVLILYSEGYRVFQLRFAPRVVRRAFLLKAGPPWWCAVAAPLYCMSLVYATRRGKTVAWITTFGILTCVVILQQIPQPYRGLIDGGVAAALAWGSVALAVHYTRALAGELPTVDDELPGEYRPP